MTTDVVLIGPASAMDDATGVLLQHKIGCLPVVDNGTLVGIVTDIDCLRAFLHTVHDA
jgi:acetoin utilization protein AcuB